ncbi:SMP-30/gluconolactonase/LRE family protein [Nevskia sp.]|uniref:SMP-30/gluconolactonase/LRE family protein n=1 Tax=Nevskia sp. TaxID=1929292 RepID=UPI0025F9870D|nr:SMP-30/gluconolactonase/LRE family protein [Nevskia sp.]
MKKLLAAFALGCLAVLAYLLLKPTPVDPVAWQAPQAPKLEGIYARNEVLKNIQRLAAGIGRGPEGIAIDAEGRILTGFDDGRVIRLSADGSRYEELANTGGRPLGLSFAADGAPIVADAKKGLLRIEGGKTTALSTEVAGVAVGFADDVDASGTLAVFSDASTKFPDPYYLRDLLEHRPNGRLLAHDSATGIATELARDLYFANGVAIGPNGDYVLVSETSAYRITRIWLKGEKAGSREVFVDNLPGFPDNLSFNGRDRIWVALAGPRDEGLDALSDWPLLRKMIARLPGRIQNRLAFSPVKQSFVLGFDLDGRLVANLQDMGVNAFSPITSVEEHGPWLYLGSLTEPSFARLPLNLAIPDAAAPPEGWQQTPTTPTRANP